MGLTVSCCSSSCFLQKQALQRNETRWNLRVNSISHLFPAKLLRVGPPHFVLFVLTEHKDSNTWNVKNSCDFINSMKRNQVGSNPTSATIYVCILGKSTQPSLSISEVREFNLVNVCQHFYISKSFFLVKYDFMRPIVN